MGMHTHAQRRARPGWRTGRRVQVPLGAVVALALGATGVYIATASAEENAPGARLEAEAFSAQSGAQTEPTADTGGGANVGWLADGDWLQYNDVTLGGKNLTAR